MSDGELSNAQLPVLRSWFAFAIAHAKKGLIDGWSIVSSDRGDWDHYAYAAAPGLLVTDDRKCREIASRIALNYVRVVAGIEFFNSLEQT